MRKDAKISTAHRMRKAMTQPEVWLWVRIRNDSHGIHFRKQAPIGPYILDFYSANAKLCVEVDGVHHTMGDRPERDAERDAWMLSEGILTYRAIASNVLADPDGTAEGIIAMALERMANASIPLPSSPPAMPPSP